MTALSQKPPHDQASAVGGLYATWTYPVKALPPDPQNRWFAGDAPLYDAISIAETHPRVNTFIPMMSRRILALASPALDRGPVYWLANR